MSKRRDVVRRVEMDVVYPHAPDRVWRALTDRHALAQWLMPNDFEPRLGHRFQFRPRTRQDGPGPVRCEVTEVDAPRRLAFTWRAPGDSAPSQVTWTLEPVESGTRLHLEHEQGACDAETDAVADAPAEAAWTHRTFTLCAHLAVGRPTHLRHRRCHIVTNRRRQTAKYTECAKVMKR